MMRYFIFVLITLVTLGCKKETNPANRPYYLGFTPFPYDNTLGAVEKVYETLATDADIVNQHFDSGIPWVEALSGADFHPNIMADWQYRKDITPSHCKQIVSITPISITRDALAPYRGEEEDMPLPSPWDTYAFDQAEVKTAYLNYCKRVVAFFDPAYLVMGIEVNLLAANDPTLVLHKQYVALHQHVYTALKKEFPDLPILVSFTAPQLLEGYTDDNYQNQVQVMDDLDEYSDLFGLSLYPYFSKYLTDEIPEGMWESLAALSNKPMAITETGYPAQSFSFNGGQLVFNSNEHKQAEFIEQLLAFGKTNELKFIVNFVLIDYDALWVKLGSPDDVNILWRDTGLYDENQVLRKAGEIWKNDLKNLKK